MGMKITDILERIIILKIWCITNEEWNVCKRLQGRWVDDIRKMCVPAWMRVAQKRSERKRIKEAFVQQWTQTGYEWWDERRVRKMNNKKKPFGFLWSNDWHRFATDWGSWNLRRDRQNRPHAVYDFHQHTLSKYKNKFIQKFEWL